MIKKEIIDNFGFDRKTLNNWEDGVYPKRKLLYSVLEALPNAFVENIKLQEKNKRKNEALLNLKK